jgi:hypothetical protein
MEEEEMKASRHTRLLKWSALLGVVAAVAATSAQAGAPPDTDIGWELFPHCTVPAVEGSQLASAKKVLRSSLCGSMAPLRRRSSAVRDTVLVSIPEAGTVLAPGTKVLLVVAK